MSKIPEGATHTAPDKTYRVFDHGCWWAYADGDWIVVEGAAPQHYMAIQAKPEWSGEGLPPVGVEIEVKHKDATPEWARPDFYKAEIVAIGKQMVIFAAEATGCETVGKIEDYEFRPVRTPEQIAAEDRGSAILKMQEVTAKAHLWNDQDKLAALYDAGLRFVEVTK